MPNFVTELPTCLTLSKNLNTSEQMNKCKHDCNSFLHNGSMVTASHETLEHRIVKAARFPAHNGKPLTKAGDVSLLQFAVAHWLSGCQEKLSSTTAADLPKVAVTRHQISYAKGAKVSAQCRQSPLLSPQKGFAPDSNSRATIFASMGYIMTLPLTALCNAVLPLQASTASTGAPYSSSCTTG